MFVAQLCLITALGFVLNLNFCCDARAAVKINTVVTPPGVKEPPAALKTPSQKQPEVKCKDAVQSESTSVVSRLLSIELPKVSFGDFVLSAQKALLEKLSNDGPAATPPPCGKTSQYIKNGVLRNN